MDKKDKNASSSKTWDYSAMRRDILLFLTIQMGLEDIMLSEVSQAEVSRVNSQSWIKRSSAAVLRFVHLE